MALRGQYGFRPIDGIRVLSVCGIVCLTDVFCFLSSFPVPEQFKHYIDNIHRNVFHPCFPPRSSQFFDVLVGAPPFSIAPSSYLLLQFGDPVPLELAMIRSPKERSVKPHVFDNRAYILVVPFLSHMTNHISPIRQCLCRSALLLFTVSSYSINLF